MSIMAWCRFHSEFFCSIHFFSFSIHLFSIQFSIYVSIKVNLPTQMLSVNQSNSITRTNIKLVRSSKIIQRIRAITRDLSCFTSTAQYLQHITINHQGQLAAEVIFGCSYGPSAIKPFRILVHLKFNCYL